MRIEPERGRYIILGAIDGVLAVLGIVLGLGAGQADVKVILGAGLGGGVALGLTNGLGSYLAETTVEYAKLAQLERALYRRLRNSALERSAITKIRRDSFTHGGFSFVGALVPVFPFFFLPTLPGVIAATSFSIAILVVLGLFSGWLSKQNIAISCLKMVGLGILVTLVTSLIGSIH